MVNINLKVNKAFKTNLTRLVITIVMLTPLFIILINSSWSNIDLVSGIFITIMTLSIVVGLGLTVNQFIKAIQKGPDTNYKEQ